MIFKHLKLEGWQQFASIDIAFHDRLTVLTGANGSGKTTLLRFLAQHFGWGYHLLRTPLPATKKGPLYYIHFLFRRNVPETGPVQVGSITYSNGQICAIRVPTGEDAIPYAFSIDNAQPVQGLFIPSHRPEFRYERVGAISLHPRNWSGEAFSGVSGTIRSLSQGGGGRSPSYHMKEILIGLAWFGYGSQVIEPDPAARELYESFQEVLRQVLPPDIGFKSLAVRDRASEIVLVTESGDFLLDAVSGGIAALLELAWQLFMFRTPDSQSSVVVIDEPENHLHASMQRRLLPNFIRTFPKAQFVVATHSPLIVGSERNSNVYVLRFEEGAGLKVVKSEQLDLRDKAGTAGQMLRDVLDVQVTMPIWAEEDLNRIVETYSTRELTPETAQALREEMSKAGLEQWIPDALMKLANRRP